MGSVNNSRSLAVFWTLALGRDEFLPHSDANQVAFGVYVEFSHKVGAMVIDSFRTDIEHISHFIVAVSADNPVQHLPFARG